MHAHSNTENYVNQNEQLMILARSNCHFMIAINSIHLLPP